MKKVIPNIFLFTVFFIFGLFITSFVYAIAWPTTPVGEFFGGSLVAILEKGLVLTGSTTDGKVLKAQDTINLGTGTIISLNGRIGIGNNSPAELLDVSGNIKSTSFSLNGITNSGYITVGDNFGNTSWLANNYRLKVESLMVNGGTYGYNCFVMEDTSVECVGFNGNGNMGIGTNTNNYYLPQKVPLVGVKKVYSNNLNTYALMLNGDIYAIGGYNIYGELGIGNTSTLYIPQKITGISNVTDLVTSGGYYTNGSTGRWASYACALILDGTVKCWGRNGTGQLGVGDTTNRSVPTQVYGISNVKKISMTSGQLRTSTCALFNDGTVKCWGWNGGGILGNGDTNDRYYPTTVQISNVKDIVMGGSNQSGNHMCALLNDGTVKCWGHNAHGELGNGTNTDSSYPVNVIGLSNIRKIIITGGSSYSNYAITNNNQVYSWGENSWGQLGVGDTTNKSTPTLIPGLNDISDIESVGRNSTTTCALLNDGTVKCWGYNAWGQLGVGDTTNRYSPVQVLGVNNAVQIQIYNRYRSEAIFACALIKDGTVKCWGNNGYGQLGQLNTINYTTPAIVLGLNKY